MIIKKISQLLLGGALLGALAVTPAGCKGGGGGGGGGSLEMPAKPEYANAFDELKDVPAQIDAQIKWITEPIDEAHALGPEFKALQEKAGLSAEQFTGLVTASFSDGKVEISADVSVAEDVKAELTAFLEKVKVAGDNVKSMPKRVGKVNGALTKRIMTTPGLAKKALDHLKGELAAAAGDAKVELEANIKLVPELQTQIVDKSKATIGDLKNMPADLKAKTEELVLAFSGKGDFKAVSAGAEQGEGEGEGDLDADLEAGGDAEGDAEQGDAEEGGEEEAAE